MRFFQPLLSHKRKRAKSSQRDRRKTQERRMVLQSLHKRELMAADVVFDTGFDSADELQSPEWEVYSSNTYGRAEITNGRLELDSRENGNYALNEAILHLDLEGRSGVRLNFDHDNLSDENDPLPASFTGHFDGDGVSISADGVTWHRVTTLTGAASHSIDLDSAVQAAGVQYTSDFRIKFQQYDNYSKPIDGRTFDNISVTTERDAVSDTETLFDSRFDLADELRSPEWEVYSSNTYGRTEINGGRLEMDSRESGNYALNEAILHLDLAGRSGVSLRFDHDNLSDESDPLPPSFTGHFDGDGVSISADGVTWHRVATLTGASSHTVDLDSAVQTAGIDYSADFRIKFQQYDNYSKPIDGRAFDNISVTAETETDTDTETLFDSRFDSSDELQSPEWKVYASNAYGRTEISGGRLEMDSRENRNYTLNEAILHLDLAGRSGVKLSFDHDNLSDENDPLPASFTGHFDGDGVSISADGVTWHRVATLTGASNHSIDLDTAARVAGINYTSDFQIKFQQYDNYSKPTDGRAFDNIEVSGTLTPPIIGVRLDNDGRLMVAGTSNDDRILIETIGPNTHVRALAVDGGTILQTESFPTSSVSAIVVVAGDGADHVENRTSIPSSLDGGPGGDTLVGGTDRDALRGGSGNDNLFGGRGDDTYLAIAGVNGNDTLHDNSGVDTLDFSAMDSGIQVDLSGGALGMRSTSGNVYLDAAEIIENVIGTNFADIIHGSSRDNLLVGRGGDDTLNGRTGDDTLRGGDGNDSLWGRAGDDNLDGGVGNDLYSRYAGVVGNDTIHDISGIDTLDFSEMDAGIQVDLSGGALGMRSTSGNVYLARTEIIENVVGTNFVDIIHGSSKENLLVGGGGDDTLNGRTGDDTLRGGDGNDSLWGRAGDDDLDGGAGNDLYSHYAGIIGNDTIHDSSGVDTLDFSQMGTGIQVDLTGGARGMRSTRGNVYLAQAEIIENVVGTGFVDIIHGSSKDNLLVGGGGDDTLNGRTGDDTLLGGDGNDSLWGRAGDDNLDGGAGDDLYSHYAGIIGNDTIQDSSGVDTLDFSEMDTGIQVDLTGGALGMRSASGNVYLAQAEIIENVIGTDFDDIIHGSSGDNVLIGRTGNDALNGRVGDDFLRGGPGQDWLRGRGGNDSLYGGHGVDILDGGADSDRILQRNGEDTIVDRNDLDAVMNFNDSPATEQDLQGFGTILFEGGTWTDEEIESVDRALEVMHRKTQNTKLLKNAEGADVSIQRVGRQRTSRGNLIGGWNDNGASIAVTNSAFSTEQNLHQTVYHEFGHFRDTVVEWSGVDAFRQLSGWYRDTTRRPGYQNAGDKSDWYHYAEIRQHWARNYSKWNPKEDFATHFAAYFMTTDYDDAGVSTGESERWIEGRTSTPTWKIAAIDQLMSDLS